MNSIDLLLLDLVQIAETPIYSSYRWLCRELGCRLSMTEFFQLLRPLVKNDIVRLWSVDVATQERARWHEVPLDLGNRYATIPDLDDSFDPFGLSLTLGPNADLAASPDWEMDFDLAEQRFVLTAKPSVVDVAQQQLDRLFPDLVFSESDRSVTTDRVRITGSIDERAVDGR